MTFDLIKYAQICQELNPGEILYWSIILLSLMKTHHIPYKLSQRHHKVGHVTSELIKYAGNLNIIDPRPDKLLVSGYVEFRKNP